MTLLSARFEGFDERIVEQLATDAISVGPYVLSNGDLPAMLVLDAVARRLPGALAEGSGELESFSAELDGGLEYPHYTRPAEFRGWSVPDVLLSGDHARIEAWRRDHGDVSGYYDDDDTERDATAGGGRPVLGLAPRRAERAEAVRGSPAGAKLRLRLLRGLAAAGPALRRGARGPLLLRTHPRSARPHVSGPAAQRPGHPRLDPHDRRRDPDRARAQAVGGQPVPDPVVVDGADSQLREGACVPGLSRQFERPRARLPHLPRLRPDPSRGDVVVFNTPTEARSSAARAAPSSSASSASPATPCARTTAASSGSAVQTRQQVRQAERAVHHE